MHACRPERASTRRLVRGAGEGGLAFRVVGAMSGLRESSRGLLGIQREEKTGVGTGFRGRLGLLLSLVPTPPRGGLAARKVVPVRHSILASLVLV